MKLSAEMWQGEKGLVVGSLFFCLLTGYMADMMLVPYYPQFFQQVYGIDSPQYVGLLIAVCRIMMMMTYPAWARLSRRVPTVKLLAYTQALAGILSLACMLASNELIFLILITICVGFKSSYLLIYPLLVNLSGRDRQAETVSNYGFTIHLATILAAVAGGYILENTNPRYILLIMCLADWMQMSISWWLFKKLPIASTDFHKVVPETEVKAKVKISRYGIAWLVFLFYISISLIRPFFTRFIEGLSFNLSTVEVGMLFVLPALMCILASIGYKKFKLGNNFQFAMLLASIVVVISTWMQVAGQSLLQIINGRIFYGLSIFLVQAGIDLLVFNNSKSKDMAWNYSLVTTAMNAALIVAPVSLGYIVEFSNLSMPFYVSTGISILFVLSATLVLYPLNLGSLKIKSLKAKFIKSITLSK